MKYLLIALLNIVFVFQIQAQCSDCNSLEEALKDPRKVKELKMNGTRIDAVALDEIPAAIGEMVNLKILYLSDFNFTSVPPEIKHLKKVKEISFAGCKLTSLPDEIYELKKLREIILFGNEFSEETIQNIKNRFKKESPKVRVMIY